MFLIWALFPWGDVFSLKANGGFRPTSGPEGKVVADRVSEQCMCQTGTLEMFRDVYHQL